MKTRYVQWNRFSEQSIKRAEKLKTELENKGYTLVHTSSSCLTYKLKEDK